MSGKDWICPPGNPTMVMPFPPEARADAGSENATIAHDNRYWSGGMLNGVVGPWSGKLNRDHGARLRSGGHIMCMVVSMLFYVDSRQNKRKEWMACHKK